MSFICLHVDVLNLGVSVNRGSTVENYQVGGREAGGVCLQDIECWTYCNDTTREKQESRTIGRRQYPSTLTTHPTETTTLLIRFKTMYIAVQPSKPTP